MPEEEVTLKLDNLDKLFEAYEKMEEKAKKIVIGMFQGIVLGIGRFEPNIAGKRKLKILKKIRDFLEQKGELPNGS